MANMAILRVAKIKTMSSLAARGKHTFRERETPNADAERTPLNQLAGAQTTDELMQRVADLLPAKRRKDAVIGLEYLITASPEHFGPDWQDRGEFGVAYFQDAIAWLEKRHGKGNVVCATLHLDESTPHLAAFVVPRTADGRLAAKDFVGGAAKLSKMQTEFADQVGKKHGLERGVEWSKAVHKPNAAIAPMTAERLALRKSVKELEAEIERLTQQVTTSGGALAAAVKKAERQQQINVEYMAVERRLTAELAAARGALDAANEKLAVAMQLATEARVDADKQREEVARLERAVKILVDERAIAQKTPAVAAQSTATALSAPGVKARMDKAGEAAPATVEQAQTAAIRAESKRLGYPLASNSKAAVAIKNRVREEWAAAEAARLAPPKELEREKPKARVVERKTERGGRD